MIITEQMRFAFSKMLDKNGRFNATKYKLYKTDETDKLLELCFGAFKNFSFYMKNNLSEIPKCPVCGKELRKFGIGQKLCSQECYRKYEPSKEKRKNTCLEKYGVDNPAKNKVIREQINKTNNEKYGGNAPIQCKEIQDKIKQTNIEKYGVDNTLKAKEVRDKAKSTTVEKYGVEYAVQNTDLLEKIKKTNLEKYGVDNQWKSIEIRTKIKDTMIEKYGVDNAIQNEIIKEKRNQTMIDRYGTIVPLKNDKIKEKLKLTNLERYGVECSFSSKDVIDKIKKTNLEKYGFENVSKNIEVKNKIMDTKRENNTFNTSKPEDTSYNILLNYFPEVIRQYKEERYPFNCDFYIPINDMFIELNYFWTHGKEPFDENNEEHLKLKKKLEEKFNESIFFKTAHDIWTKYDPYKMRVAKQNNLNYKTFYKESDFENWIHKFNNLEYYKNLDLSYPDELMIKEYESIQSEEPSYQKVQNKNIIIKNFQQGFYKQERILWEDDNIKKKLIENRIKYIGKGFGELTKEEILNGFRISKISKAGFKYTPYSNFSPQWMRKFINEYNINSIYDPCGGWGHRLLACSKEFKYWYNDINEETTNGCKMISEFLNMTNKNFSSFDSAKFHPSDYYDAVFTCPSYWNLEIYSSKGSENYSYEDFLEWWKCTVSESLFVFPKYFAYIMKETLLDDMNNICSSFGLKLINTYEIGNYKVSSHFSRSLKSNRKKEILSVFLVR